MREIVIAAIERHGLCAAAAEHRVGAVPLSEPSRDRRGERAASRRRRSTARARSSTRSRTRAPIWKREVEGDERRWVQGTVPGAPEAGERRGPRASRAARRSSPGRRCASCARTSATRRSSRRGSTTLQRPSGYRLLAVVRGRTRARPSRSPASACSRRCSRDGCSTSTTSRRCPPRAAAVTPAALLAAPRRGGAGLGCEWLQLDSGVGPSAYTAHRLYMSHRMAIVSHHFAQAALSRRPRVSRRRPRRARSGRSAPPPLRSRASQSSAQQRVLLRALDDRQQVGHRGDLLDLLLDEPLHELLAGVVGVLARQPGERVDLLGDALLLVEREAHRLDDVAEARLRRVDARDDRPRRPGRAGTGPSSSRGRAPRAPARRRTAASRGSVSPSK